MLSPGKNKKRILVADDMKENLHILVEILTPQYSINISQSGSKAIELASSDVPPDLILLDIMMPEMDGYEVCKKLKSQDKTKDIPIIFITAKDDIENETYGLQIGAVDYITKPVIPSIVLARVETHLELKESREILKNQNIILEHKVQERTEELQLTRDALIHSMMGLAETRDNETGAHIKRTQNYVKLLAEKLATYPHYKDILNCNTIDLIYKSAPLHDIGKIGIPDQILLKPGPLTKNEFEIMKRHTSYGRDAIIFAEKELHSEYTFLRFAKQIAYCHHEKWDGSGYPQGLKGDEIPLPARLMALADVYDALTTKRVYKPSFPHEKSFSIMKEGKGIHFDPEIFECFTELIDDFQEITRKFTDNQ